MVRITVTLLRSITIAGLLLLAPAAFAQNFFQISGSLPNGGINSPYNGQLTCNGTGATVWSVSNGTLPIGLGLTFQGCTATIGGTPTLSGTYAFTIQAFDRQSQSTATKSFTVTIVGNITIATPVILPNGVVNQGYNLQLAAFGGSGPYGWTLPASVAAPNVLPPGLTLTQTGLISGIPTTAGNFGFDITVTDQANSTATASFQLLIAPPMVITTPSPLPTGTLNTGYSQQIATSGGTAPYTYSIVDPNDAPPGMNISPTGVLGAAPKATGTYAFTIQVIDKFQYSATKQFQLTVAPNGPLLQTSLRTLNFTAFLGGDTPPQQSIAVTAPSGSPVNFAVTVDGGSVGTAAPSWIIVTTTAGPVPAAITVTVNQSGMQAGRFLATVHVTVPGNTSQTPIDTAVVFNVSAGPAQPTALPSALNFGGHSASPSAQDQMIVIGNSGGGGGFAFNASIAGKSSWVTGLTPAAGRVGVNAPAALRIFVNTQGLKTGLYHDILTITSAAGTLNIPITLFVSDPGPVLGLSQSGLRFQVREGAGTSQSQSVSVFDFGDPNTTSAWQAQVVPAVDWLQIPTPNGISTPSKPGILTLVPGPGAANLAPGGHYALVQVSDPNALDSPQYLIVVMDVAPAASPALPDPSPGGLFFTSSTSSTPAQTILVYTSSTSAVGFQTAAYTSDGAAWLTATPASGVASTASPGQVSVAVTRGSLPPGIYFGTIYISMNGVLRSVNVVLIVLASSGTSAPGIRDASCTASRLAITETGLVGNFAVPAGWPATLIVQLNDDCGNSVSNGSVVTTFSNGDPPISLRGDSTSNTYSATWQPGAVFPEMTITVRATSPSLAAASQQYTGAVNQNPFPAPSLAPGGILHIFFNVPMAAALGGGLAPGNVAQVYGSGLASTTSSTSVPLPLEFSGTFMLIGGVEAPLYYVSDTFGVINVQVPFELTPNRQYSAIVSANGALTLPQTVDVTAVQPGVAQFTDGTVIAQVSGTTTLITATNPAKPGQSLTIYLAGMGPTNPAVPSRQQTPLQLVPVTLQPTVTLDGQSLTPAYAGLTPTGVGLYQINFTVPANARAGNLDLVVTQNGVAANTTKLPVSN